MEHEAKKSNAGFVPQRQTTEKHSAEESVTIISSPTALSIEVFSVFTDFSRFGLCTGPRPNRNGTVGLTLGAPASLLATEFGNEEFGIETSKSGIRNQSVFAGSSFPSRQLASFHFLILDCQSSTRTQPSSIKTHPFRRAV